MFKDRFNHGLRNTTLLECMYLLLLPVAVWTLFRISIFNNNEGFLDAWIYFGYIHNFQDLIDRYGLPYYSVRFGLIFPNIILTRLFGELGGYLSFVYIMYLLAGIPLYLLVRRLYSVHSAIVAYAILASSAWFGRAVLWTHPDAAAVPYMISAFSLLLIETRYRYYFIFASGVLIAMAANSNVFTLSITGLFVVCYASFFKGTLWARIKNDTPWFATGFVLVFFLGAGGFALCCNSPNYFSSTVSMIEWGHAGNAAVYQQPWGELLKLNGIYLPLFLVVYTYILSRQHDDKRKSMLIACTFYVLAVIIFEVLYRMIVPSALLELFYYFSFVLTACAISIVLVPISLANTGNMRSRTFNLNIVLAVFIAVPLLISYSGVTLIDKISTRWVILGFTVTSILLLMCHKRRNIIPVAIILFSVTSQLSLLSTYYQGLPFYARMYSNAVDINLGNYRLGLKFIESMPTFSDKKKPIYFWYKNTDKLANSLQSTYLWGYSRLMDSSPDTYGLPELKGINTSLLESPSSMVLFDRESRNIDVALKNLKESGLLFDEDSSHLICEGEICYTVKILDAHGLNRSVN